MIYNICLILFNTALAVISIIILLDSKPVNNVNLYNNLWYIIIIQTINYCLQVILNFCHIIYKLYNPYPYIKSRKLFNVYVIIYTCFAILGVCQLFIYTLTHSKYITSYPNIWYTYEMQCIIDIIYFIILLFIIIKYIIYCKNDTMPYYLFNQSVQE